MASMMSRAATAPVMSAMVPEAAPSIGVSGDAVASPVQAAVDAIALAI